MGYWPSVRSIWLDIACLWTETKSKVHKRAKKEREQYPAILAANLVNKGFIIWLLLKFCLRDTADSPERARWPHLARSDSQSQRAIWFILPARGASHIINIEYFMESARVRCLHTSCVGLMRLLNAGRIDVAYQKSRTSERSERVRFLIQNNECVNTVQSTFHVVLCLLYTNWDWTPSLNYDKLYLNKCGQTTITERKQLRKKRKSSNIIQNLLQDFRRTLLPNNRG